MTRNVEKPWTSKRRYNLSKKGKAAARRYNSSEKGRATRTRYSRSVEGRAAKHRYYLRTKEVSKKLRTKEVSKKLTTLIPDYRRHNLEVVD